LDGKRSAVKAGLKAFGKAVGAGTIIGGGPYLLFTVAVAVGDFVSPIDGQTNLLRDLYLAVLPLLVAFVVVFAAGIVIGIPTAALLGRDPDKRGRYVLVGAVAGFLIPLLGLRLAGAEWGPAFGIGMLGTFSGGATALTWSKASQVRKA
jgi:hypothetical protein